MAKVIPIQTNFTAGELSPRVHSRVDIVKYNNGLKVSENLQHLVQGGARRRPGLRMAAETKDSGTRRARLIPFIFNREQSYMLEFGHQYMRVFKNGVPVLVGGLPYEIATPYTEAMLLDVAYNGGQDTMFLAHPEVPIYRLQRFADDAWQMLAAPFQVEPFDELGLKPATTLTLSGTTVGTGRTATAGAAAFLASDVGRDIYVGSGLATITGFSSTTVVTVEIRSAFANAVNASGTWTLDGSPQTTCTASAAGPVGAAITLTLSADGWRSGTTEIGKFVKINGGLVKITGYSSATGVSGVVQQALSSATGAIANSWSLNNSIWGGLNGYPRTVALQDQRLLAAGSPGYPQSIAGSRIGNVLNFELGTGDSDAYLRQLDTTETAPIQHLVPNKRLLVLTYSNEMSLRGGAEKPITPTNIQKDDETDRGSSSVRPVRIGKEVLFVQRAGLKVRALGYSMTIDGYDSPDRTVFSEHITKPGVVDMAYQQEPDGQLFCVRSDGQIAVSAYDVEQEVNAWGRWTTDGAFESVARIPTPTAEQTYVIAQRTIDGVSRRFVEYFDPTLYTDSAVTGSTPGGTTTLTGLGHLEGKTLRVRGDGIDAGDFEVVGGQITLPDEVEAWEAGLGFEPKMTLLNPEVGSQSGTSQGAAISIGEVIVRVLDTVAIMVNGRQQQDFRRLNDRLLDRPPEMGSGELRETVLSDNMYFNETTISQPRPVDFHVLAVIRKCTVND